VPNLAKTNIVGAAPEGASDRQSAARAVRDMFTSIAPRYDLLNHVLSFNIDRIWWRRTARTFRQILARPDSRVLDLCCGTGDMAFALQRQAEKSSARIVGADFSHAMLQRATYKADASPKKTSPGWIEADALTLPFPDLHFDLVTSAFGFRNLADYDAGLREILRVLSRWRMRHSGLRGTGRVTGGALPDLFQAGITTSWFRDFWNRRALQISACLS
jgi:demethylmenaquinone methyltransferase/2-methoxy-6-polyprenyl-1,4-benzoquinol methylase